MVKVAAGLIGMISLTVAANILMKMGAMAATHERMLFGIAHWKTLVGLCAFGCAGLVYAWVLKWLPLNVAQAFAAAQFVAVIVASSAFLSEPIPLMRWLGIGMIGLGIMLVGSTVGKS